MIIHPGAYATRTDGDIQFHPRVFTQLVWVILSLASLALAPNAIAETRTRYPLAASPNKPATHTTAANTNGLPLPRSPSECARTFGATAHVIVGEDGKTLTPEVVERFQKILTELSLYGKALPLLPENYKIVLKKSDDKAQCVHCPPEIHFPLELRQYYTAALATDQAFLNGFSHEYAHALFEFNMAATPGWRAFRDENFPDDVPIGPLARLDDAYHEFFADFFAFVKSGNPQYIVDVTGLPRDSALYQRFVQHRYFDTKNRDLKQWRDDLNELKDTDLDDVWNPYVMLAPARSAAYKAYQRRSPKSVEEKSGFIADVFRILQKDFEENYSRVTQDTVEGFTPTQINERLASSLDKLF